MIVFPTTTGPTGTGPATTGPTGTGPTAAPITRRVAGSDAIAPASPAVLDTTTIARHVAHGRRLRSAYLRLLARRAWRVLLGRPVPALPFRAPVAIVPAEDVAGLLARNDNELDRLGVRRADLEAFRDGQLKVVRRRPS